MIRPSVALLGILDKTTVKTTLEHLKNYVYFSKIELLYFVMISIER